MTQDERPTDIINRLAEERRSWSDEQILDELRLLPVLPDEDYYNEWEQTDPQYEAMDLALSAYLAILMVAEDRHLVDAISLLLERASYRDFGEVMRGVPNSLLRIAGQEYRDTAKQAALECVKSPHHGARMWAYDVLSKFDDPALFEVFAKGLDDLDILVAAQAGMMLDLWSHWHHHFRAMREAVLVKLKEARNRRPDLNTNNWHHLEDSIREIEKELLLDPSPPAPSQ